MRGTRQRKILQYKINPNPNTDTYPRILCNEIHRWIPLIRMSHDPSGLRQTIHSYRCTVLGPHVLVHTLTMWHIDKHTRIYSLQKLKRDNCYSDCEIIIRHHGKLRM